MTPKASQPSEGPWMVSSPEDDLRNSHQIIGANAGLICSVPMVSILHKANAQLIASAPTLKAENEAWREAVGEMRGILEFSSRVPSQHFYPDVVLETFNALFDPILTKARGGDA